MNSLRTGLGAGLLCALAPMAAAQLTIVSNLPGSFVDISGTGTPLSLTDDGEVDIPTTIGNSLFAAGSARVGSNGGVRFGGAGTDLAFTNLNLPNTGAFSLNSQSLLPFWDDVNTASGTLGEIYWQETMGMLIVQWDNIEFYNSTGLGTARFQVQVPSTGSTWARFVYADIMQSRPNGGESATIGYQAGAIGNDVEFSFNTPGAVTDGTVLSLVGTFSPPPPPPSNDDCGAALPIALNTPTAFNTISATTSLPAFTCVAGGADVWYTYTANSANTIIVDTCGSSFNTLLEVYSGTCAGLVSERCNNDFCGTQASLNFVGVPGVTYRIRVGGANGEAGMGTLLVTEAPPPSLSMVDNLPGTWIDISTTGTPLGLTDDGEVDITTTISNPLFAAGIVRVGSNGGIRFDGIGQDLAVGNLPLPSTGAFGLDGQSLLGFWDDLDTDSGLYGEIYWQETQGRLIVQWQAVAFFNGSATSDTVTFQIQVPANGGNVLAQFLYQDVASVRADGGGSATIGYQAGSLANENDVEWSYNTSNAVANGDVLSLITGGGGVGAPYCTANANSTGVAGAISGSGSASIASNTLTLEASSLPVNSFGFFLTSTTQAVTPNPGGSQGTLCLGGQIGRYVGAGQIKNSGATGEFSLLLNLNQIPTPNGFVSAMVGQTRSFQAWYRDAIGGNATSNFTNGLAVTFN
ncbi:MAG: hypothetical protein R3F49_17990 [Planctomycetota bacterium]